MDATARQSSAKRFIGWVCLFRHRLLRLLLGRVCKPEPHRGYPGFSPVRGKPDFAEEPVNGLQDQAKPGLLRRSKSLQTRPSKSHSERRRVQRGLVSLSHMLKL